MACLAMFSVTGVRNFSLSSLTLESFQNVEVDRASGKVSLVIRFDHLKRRQPGYNRPKL